MKTGKVHDVRNNVCKIKVFNGSVPEFKNGLLIHFVLLSSVTDFDTWQTTWWIVVEIGHFVGDWQDHEDISSEDVKGGGGNPVFLQSDVKYNCRFITTSFQPHIFQTKPSVPQLSRNGHFL